MKRYILILLILLLGCTNNIEVKQVEKGPPNQVFFCPRDNCEQQLIRFVESSRYSVHCAFFDIDLPILISTLQNKSRDKDVRLVIDSDNYYNQTKDMHIILDTKSQLSHNKFCIFDKSIIATGSFNPTVNGNTKNNNNLIIVSSKFLAENYEEEFQELWNGRFGKGDKVKYQTITYNGHRIDNYFCPEDSCAEHLINEILNAKNSIYFMTFSFTDEDVADAILYSNVSDIRGVFEKFQAGGQWSQYKRLKEFGLDISLDNNSGMMHHKVFIIDNETVVTGSYNPTSAGDNKNDENMVIIHDERVARLFLEEFETI